MPEPTPAAPAEPTATQPAEPAVEPPAAEPVQQPADLGDAGKKAIDAMKAERNEATKRAKSLEKELDEVRKSSMSEADKAAHEAEQRGRLAATADFGKRLAKTEFDALAGRRNPDVDTAKVLEYIDLARFVDENGEPDSKAIASAVERLVPKPPEGPPSFDGGTRTPAPAQQGMSQIIRKAAGRA